MIDAIISFSLRQRVFVLLATVVLLGIGVWSALRLPIDAVPDITNIQVQVNTQVPALAPEEIEKLVTFPIENEMAGIPGLTELRSLSKFGLSQVNLIFEDGTDIYRARQLVSERLQTVIDELPPGLTPKLAPISTGLGEIYYYVVEYAPVRRPTSRPSRAEQLMEFKLIHDYVIKPRLRSAPGLAEVNATGGYEKQIVIQPESGQAQGVGVLQRIGRRHRRKRRERGRQRHSTRRRANRRARGRPRADRPRKSDILPLKFRLARPRRCA